ncbi:MAG: 4-hydroxythreonine-4-phosphate dehydrogenase PdxA [bacterium]|nr:4-hydroxythreonine-4-phosphate dehydrogenase PdxA [bacterium]
MSAASDRPRIAITMGDAAGIGPEITVKCLRHPEVYEWCAPLVLGDARVINQAITLTGADLKVRPVRSAAEAKCNYGSIDVLDYRNIDADNLKMGVVDAKNGEAAVLYTKEAGKMCLDGDAEAMVSAPLNKESMRAAGYKYEGQTQILGELCGAKKYGMILLLGDLRLMLLTTHMSLREAIQKVRKDRIISMIELAWESLLAFGLECPKIAVAALNPHAGEGGMFGDEEVKEISPAVQECVARGMNVAGPIPADTVFVRARQGEFDLVVAMFHDQGLMVVKLLGFGEAVTLLAGLPIIRTSVGHGTAFDIAGQNKADHKNLLEAIRIAAQLAVKKRRRTA